MSNNVRIIAHPKTKNLFTPTKNEDVFKCQVKQDCITVSDGFISNKARVAFPALNKDVIESPAFKNLKDGDAFPIEGQIVRKLSRTPFFEGQLSVTNPNTGEVTKKDGEPYYMQDTFTTNMTEPSESWVTVELKVVAN